MANIQERISEYINGNVSGNKIDDLISEVLSLLERGEIRVADKASGEWQVREWVKEAILLALKEKKPTQQVMDSYDKLGLLKYDYENPRYRKVPGAIIREGVYIGDNAVIMPCFINIGAYIGAKTMVDINASIGSCAQIGKSCHIAASAVIGGVLEPASARPVIIEDNCFIGVHSAVLEGVIVHEGAVISAGVMLTSGTKVIDRESGQVTCGEIPSNAVVVAGNYSSKNGIGIKCAVIIKYLDEKTHSKTSINEALRENGDVIK